MTQVRKLRGTISWYFALMQCVRGVRQVVLALFCVATSASALELSEQEAVILPSGIEVYLQEMLWDRPAGGLAYRFRFVSPDFTEGKTELGSVQADLDYLCDSYALPRVAVVVGPKPSQIIVSLADQPSEFGVFDAEVVQVFEAYRIEGDACVWEAF
ncbi:DUF6497 family protein [Roseovarius sp. EL26]|uniref:DUF6497 family protein n=1 Tax=Roseovarius sp. EL26 TaxID=2126672 RepID=UPI0020B17684|nr:DUF6497 family protein [Roseovarius sp. EL26]